MDKELDMRFHMKDMVEYRCLKDIYIYLKLLDAIDYTKKVKTDG